MNLTKEKLVETLDEYLLGWEYGDIERASIAGEAKLAGFILGACFIDAMAGFFAGLEKGSVKGGSRARFINFTEKYLPNYNSEKLWEDLRCGLVHSYAEGGTYVFTDANKAGHHFEATPNGKIMLNLEDFACNLRMAYHGLRKDILNNDIVFCNAKRRYLSMGLMGRVNKEKS